LSGCQRSENRAQLDLSREPLTLTNAVEEACDITAFPVRGKELELIIGRTHG
jgi:hypothetical protein